MKRKQVLAAAAVIIVVAVLTISAVLILADDNQSDFKLTNRSVAVVTDSDDLKRQCLRLK